MTDTLAIIRSALETTAGETMPELTPDTSIADDLDLDSILFVQFLLALEELVPGLEFTQETLSEDAFATIATIGSLVAFVESVGGDVALAG